ncbi:hypothetical protein IVB12_15730 [Bradyrhizobium sp. 179]|uniref:hypothetical protein n=1 Tax=Bradyrhizobium sp. 179 TaxID=2782648 RepID=UPI001FF915D4|nr:hypothetical protein [Bradyrhizobium sp. 179]MCK1543366.1 hypothetical protein [Bradyrhizobium sp. 179]
MDSAKVWDRDAVIHLINTSKPALAKALWTIYQRQTADEQRTQTTNVRNKRGFNSNDAQFLSDVARKLPLYDFNLTDRQMAKVRPMMRKYWRQLLEEIERKGGAVVKSPKRAKAIGRESERAIPRETAPVRREIANPLYGAWTL